MGKWWRKQQWWTTSLSSQPRINSCLQAEVLALKMNTNVANNVPGRLEVSFLGRARRSRDGLVESLLCRRYRHAGMGRSAFTLKRTCYVGSLQFRNAKKKCHILWLFVRKFPGDKNEKHWIGLLASSLLPGSKVVLKPKGLTLQMHPDSFSGPANGEITAIPNGKFKDRASLCTKRLHMCVFLVAKLSHFKQRISMETSACIEDCVLCLSNVRIMTVRCPGGTVWKRRENVAVLFLFLSATKTNKQKQEAETEWDWCIFVPSCGARQDTLTLSKSLQVGPS